MIRRNAAELAADRRGATALETALVMVPFLMLIFGTLEFGRLLWDKQAVQSAAAEAARCMAVLSPACANATGTYSDTNTKSHVVSVGQAWGVALTTDQVVLSRTASTGSVSGLSEVTLNYPFQSPLSGFLPGLSGTSTIIGHAYAANWQ